MIKSLTPAHMGGTLPDRVNHAMLIGARILNEGLLYLVYVGCLHAMGRWHHFLYGNDNWVVDAVAVNHPWAATACLFAAVWVTNAVFPARRTGQAAAEAEDTRGAEEVYASALSLASANPPRLVDAHRELVRAHASGSAHAAYALANWHARGIVVERDAAKAGTLLREAAAADIPKALHDLAVLQGSDGADPSGGAAAYHGFLRSALFGHAPASAEVERCLATGTGTPRDPVAAAAWRDARNSAASPSRPSGTWPWDTGSMGT